MSRLVSLSDIKSVARDFLELKPDDENMIDVAMAIYFANKLDADPVWMFLNAPPSSAKTEICMSMKEYPETFYLSSVTKNSFLSGKVQKDKNNNEIDCSLLHKMNGKLVVIKDFTTVLSLNSNDRTEIYSQLREIYDGKYSKAYGTGVFRDWNGKIGILAAVTPAVDQLSAVGNLLGERFLHYRAGGGNRLSIAKMAMSYSTGIGEHRKDLQKIVTKFLKQLDGVSDVNFDELEPNMIDKLATLAIFCAASRTAVERDPYSKVIEVFPKPEGPARLAKQFKVLALSLAVVRNQKNVDESIYEIICKIARDSMPETRFRVLKALWELYQDKEEWYTTGDVSQKAGLPARTVVRKLEDLQLLKLIDQELGDKEEGETGRRPYTWCPSNDLVSMAQITGVI